MDLHLRPLLHETGVVVMVVMMMVGVNNNHHLRLRRDRCRETEDEDESKQELFHILLDASFPRGHTYLSYFFLVLL
ncbi:MAG: hypothetical protein WCA89_04740 [Terracidiphilus sp.]